MKKFKWGLLFFLLIFQIESIVQNYYSISELDQPRVYGNSNTEILQDILASCTFVSNSNCQSGNYEVQFDVIVSMQEQRSILGPSQPVKVEQVIFRSDLCEEFRNQIKTSI